MSFYDELMARLETDDLRSMVDKAGEKEVERALCREGVHEIADLAALLSDVARKRYLKIMAQQAMQLTRRRFGRCINMYLPLYLSNLCSNHCLYCGFAVSNKFSRKVLTMQEVELECRAMHRMGYGNLLLVSGESDRRCGMPYFKQALPIVKQYASYLQMEVQPLSSDDYAELKTLGLDQVSVYQETYHKECYQRVHPKGKKADMRWRLETAERCGAAGLDKVGLGALLGLYDWKFDLLALGLHILYLREHHWKMNLSVSFPRLRPATGGFEPPFPVNDARLVQFICALRIFDPELDLTISTRESAAFRDLIVPLGITAMSAGSSTAPGGYAHPTEDLKQWEVNDSRSVDEVVASLEDQGFEAVFHNASSIYFKAV